MITFVEISRGKMNQDHQPHIAIIDSNTLALIGMKQILQEVLPIMEVDGYGSLTELQDNDPDHFFHYFVAVNVVLENRKFFLERRHKTIVLTNSSDPNTQLSDFHCIPVNVPEEKLIRSVLMLEQYAHAQGKNLPQMPKSFEKNVLSDREIEVLSLLAQGYINKEIADQLNIGLTTVISHRKNIIEKLGMKSVSALTIYAVMHGYVDINRI